MLKRSFMMFGLLALLMGLAFFALPEGQKKIDKGDQALPFQLPDLAGKQYGLPQGEVILLNFWATWCPPCRQEMPSMIALSEKYQDQGLKLVAVSVDRDKAALEKFVSEYQLPFLVLHDADSSVAASYGVFRYPETFLIDKQGRVQAHLMGAIDWMSDEMQKNIHDLLQGRSFIAK
ncbi:MAG: TlpA disulfide reductase family protein [Mariprofundaceae bacterium]